MNNREGDYDVYDDAGLPRTGYAYQTLKFYCNEKDVKWMKDLTCLKNVANAALTLTWMPGILLRADGYETSFYKKY